MVSSRGRRRACGPFSVESVYAHAERRISLTSAGSLPRRGYHQYDLFLRLHARMAYEYRPSATFDGPVLVVRSDSWDGTQIDLGWSNLVTGPLTAVEVPGEHLDLTRRPADEKVGGHVSDALRSRLDNLAP